METIEFLGMPKAGKSTCLEIAESYLKKQGKRVRTIYEGARICPLDKGDRFMYNAWSFHNTVNRILEARIDNYDFALVDRGIYDHLTFANSIKNFSLGYDFSKVLEYYKMFEGLEDELFLFMLNPKEAIKRERKNNPFLGRVFNLDFLNDLYDQYNNTYNRVKKLRNIEYFKGENKREQNAKRLIELIDSLY